MHILKVASMLKYSRLSHLLNKEIPGIDPLRGFATKVLKVLRKGRTPGRAVASQVSKHPVLSILPITAANAGPQLMIPGTTPIAAGASWPFLKAYDMTVGNYRPEWMKSMTGRISRSITNAGFNTKFKEMARNKQLGKQLYKDWNR